VYDIIYSSLSSLVPFVKIKFPQNNDYLHFTNTPYSNNLIFDAKLLKNAIFNTLVSIFVYIITGTIQNQNKNNVWSQNLLTKKNKNDGVEKNKKSE
jgi:predicted N-formylglutamate amidohydrolase